MPCYTVQTPSGAVRVHWLGDDPPTTPQHVELFSQLAAAAEQMMSRIASCHERIGCPRCGAPVGVRCWRAGSRRPGVELNYPHRERWTQETPER